MTSCGICGRVKRMALLAGATTLLVAAYPGVAHAGLGDLGQALSGESVLQAEITKTVADFGDQVEPAATAAAVTPVAEAAPLADPAADVLPVSAPERISTPLAPAAGPLEGISASVPAAVEETAATAEQVVASPALDSPALESVTGPVTSAVSASVLPAVEETVEPVVTVLEEPLEALSPMTAPLEDTTKTLVSKTVPAATGVSESLLLPVAPSVVHDTGRPPAAPARMAPTAVAFDGDARVEVAPPPADAARRATPRATQVAEQLQPSTGWAATGLSGSASLADRAGRAGRASTAPARVPQLPSRERVGVTTAVSAGAVGAAGAVLAALLAAYLLASPALGRRLRPGTASRPLPTPHLSLERPG